MVADPKRQVAGHFPPSSSVTVPEDSEAFSEVTAATGDARKRTADKEPTKVAKVSKTSTQVLNDHLKNHSQPPCNQEMLHEMLDDESNHDDVDEGMDPRDARPEGRGKQAQEDEEEEGDQGDQGDRPSMDLGGYDVSRSYDC